MKRVFGTASSHSCFWLISGFILAFLAFFAQTDAEASWVHASRHGDTAYFLFEAPPRLERYAIGEEQWMPSLSFPATHGSATAFAADTASLFVAFGRSVKRYDLNGGNEVHITEVGHSVRDILIDNELVILNHSVSLYAHLTSVSKTNNAVLDQYTRYITALAGASIAPSINKIFGRSIGVSPADITFATYNTDGTFGSGGNSPHHGAYPGASRTWVFPDETTVVDNSGTVYSADNLTYLKSFGGAFDAIDFFGSTIPIVLRGSQLEAYSSALLPVGSYALAYTPKTIYVAGSNVWTFTEDTAQPGGVRADSIPVAYLNPPTPGEPVNPDGLSYTPDAMFVTTNGVLHLYSKSHQSLFRWDVETQSYLSTIPLLGSPSFVTYSPVNHTVYLAYQNGLIRQLDLKAEEPQEASFATLALPPLGLAAADAYVFAVDASGAWRTHYTFAPTGERISNVDWSHHSRSYAWSTVRQKMYHFRDNQSPNDLLWREINADGVTYSHLPPGGLGARKDSPLHSSVGFMPPIRVAPNGSVVLLGSGVIHDAVTLERLPVALPNAITDAAWVNGQLRTIRTVNGQTQVQHWMMPDYSAGDTVQLPGSAHGLLPVESDRLVAVTLVAGFPTFYVLDENSGIIEPPKPFIIENLHGGGTALVGWNGFFWVTQGQTFTLDEAHILRRASFNIQVQRVEPDRFRATLWDWSSTNIIAEVAGLTDASTPLGWKQFDFPNLILQPGEYAITVSVEPTGLKAWASYGFAVRPGDVLPGNRITFSDPAAGWATYALDSQCRFEFMPFETFALIIDSTPQNVGQATPLPYGAHDIRPGTVVTSCVPDIVIADPGVRYIQTGWTGAGSVPVSGSSACIAFTLETHSSLTWHWQRQFALDLVAEQGSLRGAAQGFHDEGTRIQIIPEAPFGYAFSHWLVNGTLAGSTDPFDTVLNEPKTIEAVFVRVFLDVTEEVTVSFSDWHLNRQSGTYFVTLELCLNPDSEKVLIEPFWFVVEETPYWRLMHPDGIETNSGHHYVDITEAVLAQLPFVGNGDNALDPGECVRIEGIEIYSMNRTIPTGMVYAVWADPPPVGTFASPNERQPLIVRLHVIPDEDGMLALDWIAGSAGTYYLEARSASEGEWQVLHSYKVDSEETNVFLIEPNRAEMMLFRVRKGNHDSK